MKVALAVLLLFGANALAARDFTIEWQQTIARTGDDLDLVRIGRDAHVYLAALPPEKAKDPPRATLFIGGDSKTRQPAIKTSLYKGKRYHFAVVRREGKLRWFVNGCEDNTPAGAENVDGAIEAWAWDLKVTDAARSDDEVFADFKSQLSPHSIITVGHRGDNKNSPENTNISYVNAIANHTPIVEMDLRLTADNVLILLHDPTVNRTTNGKGPILAMTLADAQKLDAGSWKDKNKYAGERIPKVQTICETCRGKAIMMLDLKCTGLGKSLAELKQKLDYPSDGWILAPWEIEEGVALRKYLPDVPMILLHSKLPADNFDDAFFSRVKQIGFSSFSIDWRVLSASFIDAAHRNDMKIYAWTVNDAPDIAGAVLAGVDGIITDDAPTTMKLVGELTGR